MHLAYGALDLTCGMARYDGSSSYARIVLRQNAGETHREKTQVMLGAHQRAPAKKWAAEDLNL